MCLFPGTERRPSGLESRQQGVRYHRAGEGQGTDLVDQVKDVGLLPVSHQQESTLKERDGVLRFCLGW